MESNWKRLLSLEKRHDDCKNGSAAVDTSGRYSMQLLGLGKGPSDVMNPGNAASFTAADVQTLVQQFNKGEMPKLPCLLTEFTNIFLRLAKIED